MKILTAMEPIAGRSIALTVGTFDGVHRGHQAILRRVREQGETAVCVTYSNHPSTVLSPHTAVPLLSTSRHKAQLIAATGMDILFLLPFTAAFASQEASDFLQQLHTAIPFQFFVLGYDALFGKDRKGTPELVNAMAKQLHFEVEYLPPLLADGRPISSRRAREAIAAGRLSDAEELLGRKVSFYSTVHQGSGKGRRIGFPTANLDITGICTPPFGVYAVTLHLEGQVLSGVANLGVAPTLQEGRLPMLEVHLFDLSVDLYEREVEVVLHAFLRPERRFSHAEALRHQIQDDVREAKRLLTENAKQAIE